MQQLQLMVRTQRLTKIYYPNPPPSISAEAVVLTKATSFSIPQFNNFAPECWQYVRRWIMNVPSRHFAPKVNIPRKESSDICDACKDSGKLGEKRFYTWQLEIYRAARPRGLIIYYYYLFSHFQHFHLGRSITLASGREKFGLNYTWSKPIPYVFLGTSYIYILKLLYSWKLQNIKLKNIIFNDEMDLSLIIFLVRFMVRCYEILHKYILLGL